MDNNFYPSKQYEQENSIKLNDAVIPAMMFLVVLLLEVILIFGSDRPNVTSESLDFIAKSWGFSP